MALFVKKFGGSSVADLSCIKLVANKLKQEHIAGHNLVVVVSAMQGETDRLINLAKQLSDTPNQRELDVLLATGEQTTIAALSIALHNIGCKARSYTGQQIKIITDNTHGRAKILHIEREKILADLASGHIVIVAGFQGIDEEDNITTLGRGGSDTTAVALAASLNADECQIYTDVDGVYNADPNIVAEAKKLPQVKLQEMLELSSMGAKVLQNRSVEIANHYRMPVRVLSTFKEGDGTLITAHDVIEKYRVTGVTYTKDIVKISLSGLPEQIEVWDILTAIGDANIDIDMLTTTHDKLVTCSFVLPTCYLEKVLEIISSKAEQLTNLIKVDKEIAKLSLIGSGLRLHGLVVGKILACLTDVPIQQISTSEIKVSVLLDEKYIEKGINLLHRAFDEDIVSANEWQNTRFSEEKAEFTGIMAKED